jgi:hypothetical protein
MYTGVGATPIYRRPRARVHYPVVPNYGGWGWGSMRWPTAGMGEYFAPAAGMGEYFAPAGLGADPTVPAPAVPPATMSECRNISLASAAVGAGVGLFIALIAFK